MEDLYNTFRFDVCDSGASLTIYDSIVRGLIIILDKIDKCAEECSNR